MNRWALLLSIFAGAISARPQEAGIKAIEPTAPGEIGVNPVNYVGTNTQYFTADATTTRWIGVDSVILSTITTTSNNLPSTLTTSALMAVSTASESSDGVEVGDLTFIITPALESKLTAFFTEVQAACGLTKLKARAGASCASGTARYIAENLPEEIAADVNEALGGTAAEGAQNGAANLVELLFDGNLQGIGAAIGAGTTNENIVLGSAVVVLGYLGWLASHGGTLAPVRIPKKKIKTTTRTSSTATSTESSKRPLDPEPTMSFYSYPVGVPFNTPSAAAMATALQGRFEALAAAANTFEITCTCTQLLHADGSKGELKCPVLNGGENCNVVSSTEAAPAPTAAPKPQPKPDPASPNACNKGRTLPDYVNAKGTFNIVGAKKAIKDFCNKWTYSFENNALKTRPQWQLYYTVGEDIAEADQGALGNGDRIYLAMRWDLVDCTNNDWWVPTNGTTPAGDLVADKDTSIASCITGFEAGLTGCEDKDLKDITMGAKNTYKCMEYFSFPSSTGKLQMPDGNAPW